MGMSENKFWAFLGVALGVGAFFYEKVTVLQLCLILVFTIILCFWISYIWNKIIDSNHKWIDAVFFFFSKNNLPYVINDKIIDYSILNGNEATYKLKCELTNKSNDSNFCYKGRYHWEQEEDIVVSVNNNFTYKCSEDFKWSNVDVIPAKDIIIHKGELVTCGFSLTNLKIRRLSKHSYLSCKMIEKVKHLKLIATVPMSLNPDKHAVFVVQNSFGDEISRETILYDDDSNTYEKTICYPRRGRKYIIKWEYDN